MESERDEERMGGRGVWERWRVRGKRDGAGEG
jgi:hypothetical protein